MGLKESVGVGLIALAWCAAIEGGEPPPAAPPVRTEARDPALAERVPRLLEALDAPQRATRTQAERDLLELGPAVLPFLPPPEILLSAEARLAVTRIRIQLERRAAASSLEARRVTWSGKAAPQALAAELERQTGNLVRIAAPVPPGELSLAWEGKVFWPAVDELATALRRRVVVERLDDGRVAVVLRTPPEPAGAQPGAWQPPLVAYAGPFRWEGVTSGVRPVAGRPGERQLTVVVRLAGEPRLRPLFAQWRGAEMHARLGEVELPAFSPEASFDLPIGEQQGILTVPLGFRLSPEVPDPVRGQRLVLTGVWKLELAAGTEEIRFRDPFQSPGVARRRGGVTVSLRKTTAKLREAGATHDVSVRIGVVYDTGGPPFESHRTWVFHNRVLLERRRPDATLPADRPQSFWPTGGFDTTLQRDGIVEVEYHFPDVPGPLEEYDFVYFAPTLLAEVPVPLRLDVVWPVAEAGERR